MNPRINIFLLAGNRLLREALSRVLSSKEDLKVVGAEPFHSQTIPQVVDSDCDVVVQDSTTMAVSTLQFTHELKRRVPRAHIVLIDMEEDETTFLKAVRAGVSGYLLQDASAMDVVAAVRAVAAEQATCPPRLCLSLFRYVAREWNVVPNVRVRLQFGLTRREQQLVPLIAQGMTNKEIACHLNLSEQTIKNHIHRMLQRVGASDRLSVVEKVRVQGIAV